MDIAELIVLARVEQKSADFIREKTVASTYSYANAGTYQAGFIAGEVQGARKVYKLFIEAMTTLNYSEQCLKRVVASLE